MGDKQKKKLTKKQQKAMNHAQLMANKKSRGMGNVVSFQANQNQSQPQAQHQTDQNKKAA
jgi:hypothetical protein